MTSLVAPKTPDGRYIVVRGRLWRTSNPALPAHRRSELVNELMTARRTIAKARRKGDVLAEKQARVIVHMAKEALGERGVPWWTDGSTDFNRRLAKNTPYADWFAAIERHSDR